MEVEASDVLNAMALQRNKLADELAAAHAYIAKLERDRAQQPAEAPSAP